VKSSCTHIETPGHYGVGELPGFPVFSSHIAFHPVLLNALPSQVKGYSSKLYFSGAVDPFNFWDPVSVSHKATRVLWIDSTDPYRFRNEIEAL
jgi:hypothetical protein